LRRFECDAVIDGRRGLSVQEGASMLVRGGLLVCQRIVVPGRRVVREWVIAIELVLPKRIRMLKGVAPGLPMHSVQGRVRVLCEV
jgi:hypothetical protein